MMLSPRPPASTDGCRNGIVLLLLLLRLLHAVVPADC